jgi:predicted ester cyclase
MSVEVTQHTMEAYTDDLIGRGPYERHFAEDVDVSIVGTDLEAEGQHATERLIDYLHRDAFDARLELTNMVVTDGRAAAEFNFVGKHSGEFEGVAATGREVSVPYCVVYDLEGEKIKEMRIYFPIDALMEQVGVA